MSKRNRRFLEAVKSLLILLLSLSAMFLTGTIFLQDGLGIPSFGVVSDNAPTPTNELPVNAAVARPIRMAVVNSSGRYGVQYDDAGADELFDALSDLLSEGLDSASSPQPVNRARWEAALSCRGIYYDFPGVLPLSLAADWLADGESPSILTAEVSCLLLAERKNSTAVDLYYVDAADGSYYACPTQLLFPEALESYIPNDAFFAFQMPEDYGTLDPDTLLLPDPPAPYLYTAAAGINVEDPDARSALLSALEFFPQSSAVYPSADGWRVRDGNDTLHLTDDGTVTFEAGNETHRYPIPAGVNRAQLVELTSELVRKALSPYCGSARPYLHSITSSNHGILLTYGCTLSGAEVQYGQDNWYAQFTVQSGRITNYTLHLRRYALTDEPVSILPEYQAIAAMEVLQAEGRRLLLHYYDNASGTVTPAWIAR